MNILAGLETFLYVISSVLLFPVVAGLVLLTFWVVISFGAFLREYIERRQGSSSVLNRYKKTLESEIQLFHVIARNGVPKQSPNEIPRFARNDSEQHYDTIDIRLERLLQEAGLGLIKSLDKIRFVIRVGPALGLMGTLIPMGISLSALAQGDMPKMAGSMVTAFTTVVVGLACSVTAYVMSLVKEKWVRADMSEMECLTELMLRNVQKQKIKNRYPETEVEDEISEETKTV